MNTEPENPAVLLVTGLNKDGAKIEEAIPLRNIFSPMDVRELSDSNPDWKKSAELPPFMGWPHGFDFFRDSESRAIRSERSAWRRERYDDDSLVIYGRHPQWPCAHGGFYNDPDFEPTPDPTLQEFPG